MNNVVRVAGLGAMLIEHVENGVGIRCLDIWVVAGSALRSGVIRGGYSRVGVGNQPGIG